MPRFGANSSRFRLFLTVPPAAVLVLALWGNHAFAGCGEEYLTGPATVEAELARREATNQSWPAFIDELSSKLERGQFSYDGKKRNRLATHLTPWLKEFSASQLVKILRLVRNHSLHEAASFDHAWENALWPQVESLDAHELLEILNLYNYQKWSMTDMRSKALQALITKHIAGFQPDELAELIRSLKKAKLHAEDSLFQAWEEEWLANLDGLYARDLRNIIDSYSGTHFQLLPSVYRKWDAQTAKNVEHMNSRDFSVTLLALAKLSQIPSPELVRKMMPYLSQSLIGATDWELRSVLHSLAVLGLAPTPQFLLNWKVAVTQLGDDFSIVDRDVSLFSFYLLRELPLSRWLAGRTTRAAPDTHGRLGDQVLAQVHQYWRVVEDIELPELAAYDSALHNFEPSHSYSPFESQMEDELKRQGVKYEAEYRTKAGFVVDFYVPAKNLVIQVDGRTHYLKDPEGHRHQRPQDLRMDEVLKAMGYEVLRVGFSKFDAP